MSLLLDQANQIIFGHSRTIKPGFHIVVYDRSDFDRWPVSIWHCDRSAWKSRRVGEFHLSWYNIPSTTRRYWLSFGFRYLPYAVPTFLLQQDLRRISLQSLTSSLISCICSCNLCWTCYISSRISWFLPRRQCQSRRHLEVQFAVHSGICVDPKCFHMIATIAEHFLQRSQRS